MTSFPLTIAVPNIGAPSFTIPRNNIE